MLPALTEHFAGEVAKIAAAIPNDRVAIQWDVCQEVLAWEGYYEKGPVDFRTETLDVLTKIGDGVPVTAMPARGAGAGPASPKPAGPAEAGS